MTQTTYDPLERRLRQRARNDEQTVEETIERLLDETVVDVELEAVVEKVIDEFDSVASITVAHLATHERPSSIRITVYTGDVDSSEEYLQLFTPDHKIAIDRDDETILTPFTVCATCEGPVTWDSKEQTTIYMGETVFGVEPIELDDGLAYLSEKLENPAQWSRERLTQLEQIRNYAE